MNMSIARLTRGPNISCYLMAKGPGLGRKPVTPINLRVSLDIVHQRIRGCANALQLADLVDEYVGLAALLACTMNSRNKTPGGQDFSSVVKGGLGKAGDVALSAANIAAPFIPGGSVVSAAISGLSQLKDAASSATSSGSGGIGMSSGG